MASVRGPSHPSHWPNCYSRPIRLLPLTLDRAPFLRCVAEDRNPCRSQFDGSRTHRTVAESTAVYRPRHPEHTSFYRIFERHFDAYVGTYEERFEHRSGPLRRVVATTVAAYLDCGRLFNGFARIRCPSCGCEHLLAFSCQTRNFCPSCQAKRAALFAEKLKGQVAAPVTHRHLVFTIPKVLRGLFQRERPLLGLLSRCAYEALRRAYAAYLEDRHAVPGFVASIQTFGSFAANFHPHIHALTTEGAFSRTGEFLPVGSVSVTVIEEIFRRLVLMGLHRRERLSEEFRENLLARLRQLAPDIPVSD